MKKIFLISCVSKKLDCPAKARDLYISPLFKFNLQFAKKSKADKIFILSAKHGLISLEKTIEPYNLTLNNMKDFEIREWAKIVLVKLTKYADLENDEFTFLVGIKYRKYLVPHFLHYKVPMQGLGIGKQLKYLKDHL